MARLTIENLDETTLARLRAQAAHHGRTTAEEARTILCASVDGVTGPELWKRARDLFGGDVHVDLELPLRSEDRVVSHLPDDQ